MYPEQLAHAKLLRDAFEQYLSHIYESHLEPSSDLLSYDFEFLYGRKWKLFSEEIVESRLQELTNILNGWHHLLSRWHAWDKVIDGRERMEAWDLRSEFLNSIAHECLLMPASVRGSITTVATQSFHQVRRAIDKEYPDYLEGEQKKPEQKPEGFVNQKKKEKRLTRLVKDWPESCVFLDLLRQINTKDYIKETRDYRNLTSHSIAPRLGLGHIKPVTREVVQARTLQKAEDSSCIQAVIPGKLAVSYGYGSGTPPLDLEIVRIANLREFDKARACYIEYRKLLEITVNMIAETEAELKFF